MSYDHSPPVPLLCLLDADLVEQTGYYLIRESHHNFFAGVAWMVVIHDLSASRPVKQTLWLTEGQINKVHWDYCREFKPGEGEGVPWVQYYPLPETRDRADYEKDLRAQLGKMSERYREMLASAISWERRARMAENELRKLKEQDL